MNPLPSQYRDFLRNHFCHLYQGYKCKADAIHQANRIINSFSLGCSDYDPAERYIILRFKAPLLLKGNKKSSELHAMNKIIRVTRELLFQLVKNINSEDLSRNFRDLDCIADDLDTASFLYFFHENMSCLRIERKQPQSLGVLCVNLLRGLKRDALHFLPLRPSGMTDYYYFAFSYENYMNQQAYPLVQYCSHPIHYFDYMEETSMSLILDLDAFFRF